MAQLIEIKVPDIGDFKDVAVIELLVKPGDTVEKETSLVTLETDKATMEIPSPQAGVVKDIRVKVGDTVSEGSLLLMLEPVAASEGAAEEAHAAQTPIAPETTEKAAVGAEVTREKPESEDSATVLTPESTPPRPTPVVSRGDIHVDVVVLGGRARRLHRSVSRCGSGQESGIDRALFQARRCLP